jgi:hypothetical protein
VNAAEPVRLSPSEPGWRELPQRPFSREFLDVREHIFSWFADYYDRRHLARAGDWMLVLEPTVPEPLVLAALTHDLERSVPGGPIFDKATTSWDDVAYNTAHCERSAIIVSEWLERQGAPREFVEGVRQPIREHEFGGSPEGDLIQAADSISFLEVNGGLVSSWVLKGECSLGKAREKLDWMFERIRLARAREVGRPYHERSVAELRHRVPASLGGS